MNKNSKPSPKQVAATKAWIGVVRAYNLCDAALNARLSTLGLRLSEHEVLANLLIAPGTTQQELAARCFVAKSGISMLITRMEQEGLLRREADARDGRIKRLYLSAQGEALAQQCLAIQDDIVTTMMQPFSVAELGALSDLAEQVAQRLEGMAQR